MNIKSHQLFAQLCEGIIFEDSTTMDLIGNHKGGAAVIKELHQEYGLAHDVTYQLIDKISWSELKEYGRNKDYAWVIMKYLNGVGAIREQHGNYIVLASNGGAVQTHRNTHGGQVMSWLKGLLGGNPRSYYRADQNRDRKELVKKRADLKKSSDGSSVTVDSLTNKFKPLWVRACNTAIADVKGMVGIMLKNDSFDKASKKMETLRKLTDILQHMEDDTTGLPRGVKATVADAVSLAAAHYYPDETGRLSKSSGYMDSQKISVGDHTGVTKLLQDISQGDQAKLGTVLAFFKQRLMLL